MSLPLPTTDRLERIEALTFAAEYAAAPEAIVTEAGLGSTWLGETLIAWASRVDVLMFNRAFCVGLASPATPGHLAAIAARFDAEEVPRSFLQLAPDAAPAALLEWGARLGYSRHNRWVKFARPLTDLPPVSGTVRVEAIDGDRAPLFGRVLVEAFRMPPIMERWEAALVGRPGWRHYLAYRDAEPVGCSALFVAEGLAALGHAGTLEAARGRGVQSAMIARRLADAAAAGCTHAVVETAEDLPDKPSPSFRNQLRHGFHLCYFRDNYIRIRGGSSPK